MVCKFFVADGVDAGFEIGDAEETPFGVDDGLDEVFFEGADGLVVFDEDGAEFLVGFEVFIGEEDGLAGEGGFYRIVAGGGFGRFRFWGRWNVGRSCGWR